MQTLIDMGSIREAMAAKDRTLLSLIDSMSLWGGVMTWREKYPEDFAGVTGSTSVTDVTANIGRYIQPV